MGKIFFSRIDLLIEWCLFHRTFIGMTTMCEIMAKMSRGNINVQDPISKAVTDKFRTVSLNFFHSDKS
jgi:hypothetical protein